MRNKYMLQLLVYLQIWSISVSASTDIIGCGGFIRSHVPIDLSLVDIRLYTKQETLKESSDCAPTNGYYFIPLSDKGEYTLRVEPPPGWFFEPKQFSINFDGVNDPCSKSTDINFTFKGFTVNGKVTTRGSSEGPEGVKISLKSENGQDVGQGLTSKGGSFHVSPVLPGSYTLIPQHPTLKFTAPSTKVSFDVDKMTVPSDALVVAGFDITGSVSSNGEPVKGVSVFITSANGKNNGLPIGCKTGVTTGAGAGSLCYVTTDSTGTFRFASTPCGRYTLRPFYESFQVAPTELQAVVEMSHVVLSEKFIVKGFSVNGRVLTAPKGKGLKGAIVYVDQTAVATTDADGRFQLDRMETGVYDLNAKSDDYTFGNARVKVSPASQELEPLVPSGVRVCGRVTPAAGAPTPRLQMRPADPAAPARVIPITQQSGQFCEFLAPGGYSVSVLLSEGDANLRYLPTSREIVVKDTPITDLEFSQLRAVLRGRITKLPSSIVDKNILVKLRTRDKLVSTASVNADDSFVFNDVAPGAYIVQVESQLICFGVSSHSVVVNSPTVETPAFVQNGYAIRIRSSHQTDLQVKSLKHELVKSTNLLKGENSICLPNRGKFVFVPSGCHGYDKEEVTWEVGSDTEVDLVAASHDMSGLITVNEQLPVLVAVLSAGQNIATLGPLKGVKSGEIYRYDFTYRVKEGQSVQFVPQASATVFSPDSAEFRGGYDCVTNAVQFSGEQGLIVNGKITPALEGVKVTLKIASMSFEVNAITKADGKFSFGPIKKTAKFELTAEKESYVLTGPDSSYTFKAHKLAQVQVTVVDSVTSAKLSGVLLSLTGGERYRKNSITEESGDRTFHSLSPGEYFLRPMMKEYKFEPASVIVQLKEGETKTISIKGRRVAFSVFGTVTSLNGEAENGVPVEVVGRGSCAGLQEEGVSDASGAFRIRGLLPDCDYTLQMKSDTKTTVYRVVPSNKNVSTRTGDVHDIRLLALHSVDQTDASVHVTATVPEHLKTLTVKLYKEDQPESPLHVVRLDTLAGGVKNWGDAISQERFLRGGLVVSLSFLNKDGTAYVVTAETSLNPAGHTYTLPSATFTADRPFLALDLNFSAKLRSIEQESPRHYVAGLFLGLMGILYWQLRQGWPAVNFLLAWWSSRQEGSTGSSDKKKIRTRKT